MTWRKPMTDENGEVRELNDADFALFKPTRGRPPMPESQRKRRTSIMLDPDVIERLKADGRGWQTRANAILRDALDL